MLSLDISCHHQIRLKQQYSAEALNDHWVHLGHKCSLDVCMPPLYLPCLLLLYRILPYLLTLIVGVCTSGTFLWPLPSLGMYCLGLPAICEWSCLPNLLGSIEVRIWGQVSSVSWDTYYMRECFTTYRLWEFEFHSRFCFHDIYIVEWVLENPVQY